MGAVGDERGVSLPVCLGGCFDSDALAGDYDDGRIPSLRRVLRYFAATRRRFDPRFRLASFTEETTVKGIKQFVRSSLIFEFNDQTIEAVVLLQCKDLLNLRIKLFRW